MHRTSSGSLGLIRPTGSSPGTWALVLAWVGGAVVLRLTGAVPVAVVLAAGLVLAVGAGSIGGWIVARTRVGGVQLGTRSTVGEMVPVRVSLSSPGPVLVSVEALGATIAEGWATNGSFAGVATPVVRGRFDRVEVSVRAAGAPGLVWWARRTTVTIPEHVCAPAPRAGEVEVEESGVEAPSTPLEVEGVRSWRDGDSGRGVHWPSTVRSGMLLVHDRGAAPVRNRTVRLRAAAADADDEAGRGRHALESGLRDGHRMFAAVGDGPAVPIDSADRAAEWSADVDLGSERVGARRARRRSRLGESGSTSGRGARWWSAVTTLVAVVMLAESIEAAAGVTVAAATGIGVGALVTARSASTGEPPSTFLRVVTGIGGLVALLLVAASSGRVDDVLGFLRGPLPLVLVVLVVLHGFETIDRRTVRVSVAVSAVVVMYASGFRVDDELVWWLLAWGVAAGSTILSAAGREIRRAATLRSSLVRVAGVCGGAAATVGLLIVVPVPDGPARLTLPTFVADDVTAVATPGAVAAPDGDVLDSTPPESSDPERSPLGAAGGYVGFAPTMDTSVRGRLGDDLVMRVRAPAPDFWRGQTFARFDGRTWYADEVVGRFRTGPQIAIPSAVGDLRRPDGVVVEEFVQTYFVETDLPNVVFHAYQPSRLILGADVWTRPDGAIRASTVLPAGSIYTVVSQRPSVDAAILRRQGDIGVRLNSRGRDLLAPYLEVPPSTSPETVELAADLAEGRTTTFDVVDAYIDWLEQNVVYDLDAPRPEPGEDAVHDFLFDTQRGFCEQIASALTVMLRTRGVPARLATGYLPGTRDRFAGVYEVRARDAHAWVEVWFPETGWQAFDPTASVPLSADSSSGSVGVELLAGAGRVATEQTGALALATAALLAVGMLRRSAGWVSTRRRRGRWGVAQDRFTHLAVRRGSPEVATNRDRAEFWRDDPCGPIASMIAEVLDRVAFDPRFDRSGTRADEEFVELRRLLRLLARSGG
ncbi:MAG: transglutaminaseTgpA domain-containing protein [Ilumatobacteraceae bacterium]